jgi:cob(I)alamin adenosyltransferase
MGHRLTKIYTRTGDAGATGLADGSRVDKDDLSVETFGTLDELNSTIGQVLAEDTLPVAVREILIIIQNQLFDLGSEYCLPGYQTITEEHWQKLEQKIDQFNADLPPLKEFILPGGVRAAAACHVARTVCRRAERRVVSFSKKEKINLHGLIYLNRLSDLLFVIARFINRFNHQPEPLWQHERKKK